MTNQFPVGTQLPGAAVTQGTGATFTNANGYSFTLTLANGAPAQMTAQAKPAQEGFFTNVISVYVSSTVNFSTNVVVLVTNATPAPTNFVDLAVGLAGPPSAVFSNDWMTYSVGITNLGPGNATNIFVTNSLPSSVGYIGVFPEMTRLGSGTNVAFKIGKLDSGAFTNLHLTVQTTNAGTQTFVSVVDTNNFFDTNPSNNMASIGIPVLNFFTNTLTAFTNTTQKFNPQNSLMEQLIVVSNTGPATVSAARVIVLGLTNFLYNAVGTNDGKPFVVYAGSLGPGQSVDLLLQYFSPSHRTFPGPQMTPLAVVPPNLSPPSVLSTNMQILGISRLGSGAMLIAFPSVSNRNYTVEYSTNLLSTNWLAAQPARTATANYTQWIDYGPPETLSHPTNSFQRFYRVFLNP